MIRNMSKAKALFIIVDGVEELEAVAPIDLLRRAGVEVTVAAASGSNLITGRNNIRLGADCLFEPSIDTGYDLVVVPGGPGHKTLRENAAVLEFLSKQQDAGRLIGSICAGPVVLKEAGVLEGKRYTSFPGTAEELPERESELPVVVDGNLITSQGAGTAFPFGLALVEALCGKEVRDQIARSTCYSG